MLSLPCYFLPCICWIHRYSSTVAKERKATHRPRQFSNCACVVMESEAESNGEKKVKLADEDVEDDDREIPSPEFDVGQTVLARDKDGLLYEAVIRRSIWGLQQHFQIAVGMLNSEEEIEKIIDQDKSPTWHYFVHYIKWKVRTSPQGSREMLKLQI